MRALLSRRIVTLEEIHTMCSTVVHMANEVDGDGLDVRWDTGRAGYGLFATRRFYPGEFITAYGGVMHPSSSGVEGDYVAQVDAHTCIDGLYGFLLPQKGRWCNEYDAQRSFVNATLGRAIRAACLIEPGDQVFVDYGANYQRTY